MGYEICYLDGTIKTVGKSKFKQLRRRDDFEPLGKGLRQIRRIVAKFMAPLWLTRMPPADIRNIEKPECKNLAKIGTSYGNGTRATREMIEAALTTAPRLRT